MALLPASYTFGQSTASGSGLSTTAAAHPIVGSRPVMPFQLPTANVRSLLPGKTMISTSVPAATTSDKRLATGILANNKVAVQYLPTKAAAAAAPEPSVGSGLPVGATAVFGLAPVAPTPPAPSPAGAADRVPVGKLGRVPTASAIVYGSTESRLVDADKVATGYAGPRNPFVAQVAARGGPSSMNMVMLLTGGVVLYLLLRRGG